MLNLKIYKNILVRLAFILSVNNSFVILIKIQKKKLEKLSKLNNTSE